MALTTPPVRVSRSVSERPAAGTPEDESAARLLSETAHDLRSPLTTIRESIRIVHGGDVGPLNEDQQCFLGTAIDQCACMDQMIGDMLHWERLRGGTPRVQRKWVAVAEVRRAIDETLRPWALPRQISIRWDGLEQATAEVFADPLLLRRLVVNLVTNAIRVTADGGSVLVRLERARRGEAIRWSVIDQGGGISETELQRIARRETSLSAGEGLGLSICRQLAALHFSCLQIQSRLTRGTQVSFETAAAGPCSVAKSWSQWRISQRGPRLLREEAAAAPLGSSRRMRLDPPEVTIRLSHESISPRSADRLSAGIVTLGAAVSRETADQFDQVLQSQSQMFDLIYRVHTRRWVWVLDADADGAQERIDSIVDAVNTKLPAARMKWSAARMIPIDRRRTQSRLSDLLVRETLASVVSSTVRDNNEVRPGTPPLELSEVAARRLDEELRRLASRLCWQTEKLQQHARSLRPKA